MKLPPLSPVIGALRLAGRRACDVGKSALTLWTDAGETSALQLRAGIVGAAHASETHDREAAAELSAGLDGLKDGRADPEDLAHFQRAARLVSRSAELDHDIAEAVQS